jgi:hypothetical protein
MAYEIPGFKLGTLLADADLRTKQYCFVRVHTTGKVALGPIATGGKVIGVLQNKPNIGEACEIMVSGVTFLQADGTGATVGDGVEAVITTGFGQTAAGAVSAIVGTWLETVAATKVGCAYISCGWGYIET